MFLRISTSSVCSAAFVMRFLIFMIFTMASYSKSRSAQYINVLKESQETWIPKCVPIKELKIGLIYN